MGSAGDSVRLSGLEILDRVLPAWGDEAFLHRVVAATLSYVERPQQEVSLLLAGDEEIAALHDEFLGDAKTTDVISFGEPADEAVDVVVNVAMARREAESRGSRVHDEVALYVVHGLLHCAGYDDHESEDRRRMRCAENDVMRALELHHAPVDE